MKALQLVFALLRIPKLFASLLLVPLVIGLFLVYLQLFVTGLVLSQTKFDGKSLEAMNKQRENFSVGRLLLYGDGAQRPELKVCRWVTNIRSDGTTVEGPGKVECQPDRLDVALHVLDPQAFQSSQFEKAFQGHIDRLHICRTCHPDVIVDLTGLESVTTTKSVWGIVVISLITSNTEARKQFTEAVKEFDQLRALLGTLFLDAVGFTAPIQLTEMAGTLAVVFNIAGLIIVALWLALRAHRKILDYFARSGALLPMAAATGKRTFYLALWILTGLRVGAFLAAGVPLIILGFSEVIKDFSLESLTQARGVNFPLWVVALLAGMGMATLIGSISELKHRHQFFSFLYRYIPLLFCSIGGLIWLVTFVFDGDVASWIRIFITSVPLIGLVPVIVAPIFPPQAAVLLMHTVLTVLLIVYVSRHNARWFAAHLEEL